MVQFKIINFPQNIDHTLDQIQLQSLESMTTCPPDWPDGALMGSVYVSNHFLHTFFKSSEEIPMNLTVYHFEDH